MSAERESADVFDFVDAYLADLERGVERPLAHWLERFPRSPDAIAREYLALRHPASASDASGPPSAASAADARRVGPYRCLRELGRGGQGTVFLAEDTRIARRVALKVLTTRFESIADEKLKRFRREAEVIARLEHPGLCTIYDADIDGTTPWIAMRYVEGRTLAEIVADARRTPGQGVFGLVLPPGGALEVHAVLLVFERAARALHAAHEAGVVHRDVKPGNVLLALDGRPVLLDFGLARDESSEIGTITQSGDVFGTPAYMSPEQLALKSEDLDRRTDVYSLGVALFEALTLVRPFERESRTALYKAISIDPPPDARKLNPALSEDVKVVLETALAKERDRRYATALDLAEDLRRIREYEPIRARRASVGLRFARWIRRHPVLALATIGTISALAIGLTITLSLLAAERQALSYAVGRHLAQRAVALAPEDPPAALCLGIEAVERAPNDLTRASLFRALEECWLEAVIEPARTSKAKLVTRVASSTAGNLGAAAFDDGFVHVLDFEHPQDSVPVATGGGAVVALEFDRAGTRILVGSADGLVCAIDARSRSVAQRVDLGAPTLALELARDDLTFLVVSKDGPVRVFEAGSCAERCALEARPGEFTRARFAPDGRSILAHAPGSAPVLFDAQHGRRLRTFEAAGAPTTCAEFGRGAGPLSIVLGAADGSLRTIDAQTGADQAPTLRVDGAPTRIVADGGGARIAVLVNRGDEGWAWLCTPATGRVVRLEGHKGRCVTQAAFSPDGTQLATTSFDTSVQVVDVESGRATRVFNAPYRHSDLCWSSDGRRLLGSTVGSVAHVWFAASRPDVFDLEGHTGAVVSVEFSPDGRKALTASVDGTARVWDVALDGTRDPGSSIAVLRHPAALARARFSGDGATVLTLGKDGALGVWNARDGSPLRPLLQPLDTLVDADLDPRGTRVVTLGVDGRAWLHPARAPDGATQPTACDVPRSRLTCATFSPDGTEVAIAGDDDAAWICDARDGRRVRTLAFTSSSKDRHGIVELAYRPRTHELAAACRDIRLRAWNTETGAARSWKQRIREADVTADALFALDFGTIVFSSDGTRLVATSRFGGRAALSIDVEQGSLLVPKTHHTDDVTSVSVGPVWMTDARSPSIVVMTTSRDGTAAIWDAASGVPVTKHESPRSAVLCGALDTQSPISRAITGSEDGRVQVWPVDPLPAARARRPRELTLLEKTREGELAWPLEYP